MVDYSKVHEVIAETNEGILLAEYQPEYRTDREYQSEADLENQLISDLVKWLRLWDRCFIHYPLLWEYSTPTVPTLQEMWMWRYPHQEWSL